MFMVLISMLKTMKNDKLNQKLIKHLEKCQFSNDTHNLLLEYYKSLEIEN
jgi:hypothetical protein